MWPKPSTTPRQNKIWLATTSSSIWFETMELPEADEGAGLGAELSACDAIVASFVVMALWADWLELDVDDLRLGVAQQFLDPLFATDAAVLHAAIGNAEVVRTDRVDPDMAGADAFGGVQRVLDGV